MWYLIAAILGSSSLVIILKMLSLKRVNMLLGITLNYVVGGVLAFLLAPMQMPVGEIIGSNWFVMAMVIGVVFMVTFIIYGLSAQRSGVAITTISGRAAVVIPVVFAFTVLGEQPTLVKIAMLLLIIVAMSMILRKQHVAGVAPSAKRSMWVILLPVAVFVMNGVSDTMVQYGQRVYITSADYIPLFMGTMFSGAAIVGVILFAFSLIKQPHVPNRRDILWGSILGVINWICMIGVFNALTTIDGSVFYPLYYTGAIVCSTVAGVWFFKERLSKLNYIGIGVAIIAIAVLSML